MTITPDPIDAWQNAPLSRDLPTEPVRTVRERFLEAVCANADYEAAHAAEAAWQLILDAWRVIEVADARGEMTAQRACVEREVWYAALRVAIFRAEQSDAPELAETEVQS